MDEEFKKYIQFLEGELMSCYQHFAYIDGVRQMATDYPELFRNSFVWSDLYRYGQGNLVLTISRLMDKHQDSVTVAKFLDFLATNAAKTEWEMAGASGHILKFVASSRSELENLALDTCIKHHRDWTLAHNDPRAALERADLAGLKYKDLKRYVLLMDRLYNQLWLERANKEVSYNFIYVQTLNGLFQAVRQAFNGLEAMKGGNFRHDKIGKGIRGLSFNKGL